MKQVYRATGGFQRWPAFQTSAKAAKDGAPEQLYPASGATPVLGLLALVSAHGGRYSSGNFGGCNPHCVLLSVSCVWGSVRSLDVPCSCRFACLRKHRRPGFRRLVSASGRGVRPSSRLRMTIFLGWIELRGLYLTGRRKMSWATSSASWPSTKSGGRWM